MENEVQRPYRILVLTDTLPWGHRSIARAIFGYLRRIAPENNWTVDLAEVKAEMGQLNDMFAMMTRYFPETYSLVYKFMDKQISARLLNEVSVVELSEIKAAVNQVMPDLVISTYYIHTHCLARWKMAEGPRFKLWTVVSDPWSVNLVTIIPKGVDLHLVYDEVGERVGLEQGLAPMQILKTGWWVREEMYQEYDRVQVRKSLGIMDDRPTLFVGGGSFGNSALPRTLPMLLAAKRPIAIIFNTGTDKLAYSLVAEYAKGYKRSKKKMVQIINLGWIENMAEVLTACDIVFGKAGPNFLMDSVARRKPFVAISHIAGNEDGNLDLIRERGLGWVKEKYDELEDFIKAYMERPEAYHLMFSESLATEAERNRLSLPMIADRVRLTQNGEPVPFR
ncbi:MAG: MGDG synthase family glycosyltransferase [Anaerolineae bacterium]